MAQAASSMSASPRMHEPPCARTRFSRHALGLLHTITFSRFAAAFVTALLVVAVLPAAAQRWHASAMRQPERQAAPPLDDMAHMSWTRRDGAPSDIAALAQTPDGYLWVGSRLGLFRFDGLQFSPYPFTAADPQLPSSDISALAACPDGSLWIGYRLGGISYLRGTRKVDYDSRSGLVGESTEQIVCRADGSVWATADGRLMHFTGLSWENYSARHGLASDGLYSLFFDRDSNLWTAWKGHIVVQRRGDPSFREVPVTSKVANQFAQLPDGTLWVADAWTSIHPLNDTSGRQAVQIPGVPVITVDAQGSLWLAQDFGGVIRIRSPAGTSRRVEHYTAADGLTDGQTRAILTDRDGSIWVGTARGLDRFQPSTLVHFHDVRLDYYPALAADRTSGIWLNDMDKPLMRLRGGRLKLFGIPHGSSSLFQDRDGGVSLLDPITHQLFRYTDSGGPPNRIPAPLIAHEVETWCLGEDLDGAVLAGFEGHGLWRYSHGAWSRITAPGLPPEAPLTLMKSDAGRVWIGYAHDQIVLEDRNGFHTYDAAQGLDLNSVLAFFDTGGVVLAGGSDGLASFDGQSFHTLQLRTPGLLRGISGIVRDRWGDLWLNAGSGVLRIPAAEWQAALRDPRYPMNFQLLNERNGLLGSPAQAKPTPSAIADTDGVLWFATSGHLTSLNPAAVHTERAMPTVLLDSVLVNGAVIRDPEKNPLKTDARRIKTLEFRYIGIDLNAPDRVTYQYMLEGQDHDWQDAGGRREAFYNNLAPGSYRFRVRAASGTGPWSESRVQFSFRLTPAPYQTRWFRVLCMLLAGCLLWLFYRLRVQFVTAKVQERLEERAHERVRIARDLHDTLLQGVQGLVLRFHFATEQISAAEPARDMLRAALDRADQVIREGRDKVMELRAETGALKDLADDLAHAAQALEAGIATSITVRTIGTRRSLHAVVHDELYSIGREALTNAVRHAEAANIDIDLLYEPKQFLLRCRDDGRGLSPEVLRAGSRDGHWGIVGMRERAVRLGGRLDVQSVSGAGVVLEVRVPARRAYRPAAGAQRSLLDRLLAPLRARSREPRPASSSEL